MDLDHFAQFILCIGGPNQLPATNCPPGVDADLDDDLDVDLIDYTVFAASFTGAMEAG